MVANERRYKYIKLMQASFMQVLTIVQVPDAAGAPERPEVGQLYTALHFSGRCAIQRAH